ncbi:MAG: hypothetical protein QM744_02485 [Mesorhizobium sp.]
MTHWALSNLSTIPHVIANSRAAECGSVSPSGAVSSLGLPEVDAEVRALRSFLTFEVAEDGIDAAVASAVAAGGQLIKAPYRTHFDAHACGAARSGGQRLPPRIDGAA